MKVKKYYLKIKYFTLFLINKAISIVFKKNRKYIIFGAWQGIRFADNSRYLYNHFYKYKEKYGLTKLIWISRSKQQVKKINNLGFEACYIYSIKSIYYHLKSYTHIISNYPVSERKRKSDILGGLSYGSLKIQLWHGIGIKKIPYKSGIINNRWIRKINNKITPWKNCYWIASSEQDYFWYQSIFKTSKILTVKPIRQYKLDIMFQDEIDKLKFIKSFTYIIGYFPTFRDDYSNYKHPLENEKTLEFIEKNNILWVEKKHLASNYKIIEKSKSKNVLLLDESFDINIILNSLNLIITDYSTIIYDAIYLQKKIILYIPDLEYYKKKDRGFLVDFPSFLSSSYTTKCTNLSVLIGDLKRNPELTEIEKKSYKKIFENKFGGNEVDISDLGNKIIDLIREGKK